MRAEHASSYGGFELYEPVQTAKLRSAFGILLSKAGEKILNGDFNLTRISFPIQCMSCKSSLETFTLICSTLPVFMNYAASITDPLERMKLLMAQNFSFTIYEKFYYKPLNPILGETFQCEGQDGASIFVEQTSHHPPVSHIIVDGPENKYNMTGYMEYAVRSGIRSAAVQCKGGKIMRFHDGQVIKYGQVDDLITGVMMGNFGHQLTGTVEFHDEENDLHGHIQYGAYTFSKQDYCWGEIKRGDGTRISEIKGTYVGYLDFDGVRYWDYREKMRVHTEVDYVAPDEETLPSQASKRTDGIFLLEKTVEEAQEEKERLEELQRSDRKLRETVEKRRKEGGAKIVYPNV